MDPLKHLNPIEQEICNRADLHQIPIAGNIELLPLCNMSCKMCFAKMTREEMQEHAPMHTWQEWLAVAEQFSREGTIFLLLTGGEPFLYPDIERLYEHLRRLGLIISFNTNGTLISENVADFLAKDPPRRMNITLYGASDETYGKLCGNPKGFTQVMQGVERLRKRGISIKFNCSLTPDNIRELDAIYETAVELDIPIDMGFYMFPPVRENNRKNVNYRLDPKEAAKARFRFEKLRYGENLPKYVQYSLKRYREYRQNQACRKGYTCRSGNSVFWMNYDGTMSACSFTSDCQINVFQEGFSEAWKKLKDYVAASEMSPICHECKMLPLCGRCAAAAISETGVIGGVPEYYCELTEEYLKILKNVENEL